MKGCWQGRPLKNPCQLSPCSVASTEGTRPSSPASAVAPHDPPPLAASALVPRDAPSTLICRVRLRAAQSPHNNGNFRRPTSLRRVCPRVARSHARRQKLRPQGKPRYLCLRVLDCSLFNLRSIPPPTFLVKHRSTTAGLRTQEHRWGCANEKKKETSCWNF